MKEGGKEVDVKKELVELILDANIGKNLSWYDLHDLTNKKGGCAEYFADYLISNGVTVQEWTSISEPPKENGYYLCYALTSAVGDKMKYEQMPLYWEDDIWLYRHNSYRMCRNVTHWMALPEPPKKNN